MEWFGKYYKHNHDNSVIIKDYEKYFQKKDKITDLDFEYEKSMLKINNLSNEDSLEELLKDKTSLYILEIELEIIKLLSKYTLQNNYLNLEFFMKCIKLMLEMSSILSQRLKLPKIIHKLKNYNNYLPRCSYKFCNFKNDCFYNYNLKTKNICYQDHYVHNMIEADLIILKDYINIKFNENNLVVPNKEILKTINTLSYVIEHMYSELKSRCLYLNEDEYEKEHFIKKNSN
mgnify:CR=1 FL=1|tara:strand:- start:1891 stop:2583 length:693 start_codon:yes stop_codon:yes gene_type:complete